MQTVVGIAVSVDVGHLFVFLGGVVLAAAGFESIRNHHPPKKGDH